jgi:hypothetical protein
MAGCSSTYARKREREPVHLPPDRRQQPYLAWPTDPAPTNNIYVTSMRPLTSAALKEIFDEEASHETTPWRTVA